MPREPGPGRPPERSLTEAGDLNLGLKFERDHSSLGGVLDGLRGVTHGCTGVRELLETPDGPLRFSVLTISPSAGHVTLTIDRRIDHHGPIWQPFSREVDHEATTLAFEKLLGPPPSRQAGHRTFGLHPTQFANVPRRDLVGFTPNSYGLDADEFLISEQQLIVPKGAQAPEQHRAFIARIEGKWHLGCAQADVLERRFNEIQLGFSLPTLVVDGKVYDEQIEIRDYERTLELFGGDPNARQAAQIVGLDLAKNLKVIFVDGGSDGHSVGATLKELRALARSNGLRYAGLGLVGPDVHLLVKNDGRFEQGNSPYGSFHDPVTNELNCSRGVPAQLQISGI